MRKRTRIYCKNVPGKEGRTCNCTPRRSWLPTHNGDPSVRVCEEFRQSESLLGRSRDSTEAPKLQNKPCMHVCAPGTFRMHRPQTEQWCVLKHERSEIDNSVRLQPNHKRVSTIVGTRVARCPEVCCSSSQLRECYTPVRLPCRALAAETPPLLRVPRPRSCASVIALSRALRCIVACEWPKIDSESALSCR